MLIVNETDLPYEEIGKIIDDIIKEPLGGAHCDYETAGNNLKETIVKAMDELKKLPSDKLKEERYNKFRRMGVFCQ